MTPRDKVRVAVAGPFCGRVGIVVGEIDGTCLVLLEGDEGSRRFERDELVCVERAPHARCSVFRGTS